MGRGLAVAAVRSLSEGRPRAVLPRRRRAWSGLQPPGAGRQGHLCGLHGSGGVPRVRTAGAGTARDLGWAVYGGARSHPDRGSRRSSVCLTGRQQSRRRRPLPSPAHPARCGHRGHTSVDYARRIFGRALLASPANSPRSGWSVRAAWSAATPAAASRAAGVRRTPPSRWTVLTVERQHQRADRHPAAHRTPGGARPRVDRQRPPPATPAHHWAPPSRRGGHRAHAAGGRVALGAPDPKTTRGFASLGRAGRPRPANAYNVGAISSHTATDPLSRVRLHDPAGLGGQRVAPPGAETVRQCRDGKTMRCRCAGMHRQGPEEVGMSIMGFEPFRDFDRLTSQLVSGRRVPHGVALDAWRSGDAYRVALDLPGVDPERIELICERNGLTIRAERAADYGEQDEVLIAGRPVGTFTRQLILGDELDTQAIRADYRNGVLHVTIPVAATAQPRRIQVTQTAEPAGQPKTIDVADRAPAVARSATSMVLG